MDPTLWIPITAAAAANTTIWGNLAGIVGGLIRPADASDATVDSKFTPKPIALHAHILHEGNKHFLVFKDLTFTTTEIDPDTGDQKITKSEPYDIHYEIGTPVTTQDLLNCLDAENTRIRIFKSGTEISLKYDPDGHDQGKKALNESLATFLFGDPKSTLTISGETSAITRRTIYNTALTEDLFKEAIEDQDLLDLYYEKQENYFKNSAKKLRESVSELKKKEAEARSGLIKYFGGTFGVAAVAVGVVVGAIALVSALFPPVGAALAAATAAIAAASAVFTPSALLSTATTVLYIAVWMGVLAAGAVGLRNNFKRFVNRYFQPLRDKMSKKATEIADKTDEAAAKLETEKQQIKKVIELANKNPKELNLEEVKKLAADDDTPNGKLINPSRIVTTIVNLIKAEKLNGCKEIDLSGCDISDADRQILEDTLDNLPEVCELEDIKINGATLSIFKDADQCVLSESHEQIVRTLGEHASPSEPKQVQTDQPILDTDNNKVPTQTPRQAVN